MRRRPSAVSTAPAALMRYDASDWPNPTCHPECAFWDAVSAWTAEGPDDDSLLGVDGPDGPWHPELI